MKKYLILGASGLLGTKLLSFFPQSHGTFFKNNTCAGSDISFLDIADKRKQKIGVADMTSNEQMDFFTKDAERFIKNTLSNNA